MKAFLAPVALLLTVIAAVFALQQRRTAEGLRSRVAVLSAELQQKSSSFEAQISAPAPQQHDAPTDEAASSPNDRASSGPASPSVEANAQTRPASLGPLATSVRDSVSAALEDPSMKKGVHEELLALKRQIYADYAKSRGLSSQQAEHLFQLLTAKGDIQVMDDLTVTSGDGGNEENSAANAEGTALSIAEIDRQLQMLLGDSGYADFQEYQKTSGEREILGQIRKEFAGSDVALTSAQAKSLFEVLVEERAKTPPSPLAPGETSLRDQMRVFLSSDNPEHYYQVEEGLNQRILSRVGGIISTDQLRVLDSYLRLHFEKYKFQMEITRKVLSDRQDNSR